MLELYECKLNSDWDIVSILKFYCLVEVTYVDSTRC